MKRFLQPLRILAALVLLVLFLGSMIEVAKDLIVRWWGNEVSAEVTDLVQIEPDRFALILEIRLGEKIYKTRRIIRRTSLPKYADAQRLTFRYSPAISNFFVCPELDYPKWLTNGLIAIFSCVVFLATGKVILEGYSPKNDVQNNSP